MGDKKRANAYAPKPLFASPGAIKVVIMCVTSTVRNFTGGVESAVLEHLRP
jgi:hypothetical protein